MLTFVNSKPKSMRNSSFNQVTLKIFEKRGLFCTFEGLYITSFVFLGCIT